jgi:hypothetical protein
VHRDLREVMRSVGIGRRDLERRVLAARSATVSVDEPLTLIVAGENVGVKPPVPVSRSAVDNVSCPVALPDDVSAKVALPPAAVVTVLSNWTSIAAFVVAE